VHRVMDLIRSATCEADPARRLVRWAMKTDSPLLRSPRDSTSLLIQKGDSARTKRSQEKEGRSYDALATATISGFCALQDSTPIPRGAGSPPSPAANRRSGARSGF
jgi:hypothetical protein